MAVRSFKVVMLTLLHGWKVGAAAYKWGKNMEGDWGEGISL